MTARQIPQPGPLTESAEAELTGLDLPGVRAESANACYWNNHNGHMLTVRDPTRITVFGILMLCTWLAFWVMATGHSHAAAWQYGWLLGMPSLFVWSFYVRRAARVLGLLGWFSVLAMLLMAILLPVKT